MFGADENEKRSDAPSPEKDTWRNVVADFQRPSTRRALWQLANTLGPYVALWFAIYAALQVSVWLALPLAVIAAGFLVRLFIIFHDCTHGSFLKAPVANHLIGFISGVLTFCPYHHWRWEHSVHHSSAGDLDRRGTGDIWTMTVQEYLSAPRWRRLQYRLMRNPLVLFVIAPVFVFGVGQRFSASKAGKLERRSVWWTNLAILAMVIGMAQIFGALPYLLIQALMVAIAGAAGLWLFYVQHQFEDVYWERGEQWSYTSAALQGSSYYKLPRVLQWLSGNIGFHHVHHLSARIPNYRLQQCHESHPLFQAVKPLTVRESWKSLKLRFWDEQSQRLVGYAFVRELRKRQSPAQL